MGPNSGKHQPPSILVAHWDSSALQQWGILQSLGENEARSYCPFLSLWAAEATAENNILPDLRVSNIHRQLLKTIKYSTGFCYFWRTSGLPDSFGWTNTSNFFFQITHSMPLFLPLHLVLLILPADHTLTKESFERVKLSLLPSQSTVWIRTFWAGRDPRGSSSPIPVVTYPLTGSYRILEKSTCHFNAMSVHNYCFADD